jgi:hypothetical protein
VRAEGEGAEMTERPTIHLVIATGGAYSDRVVWVVAAFSTEAEAVDCANQRNIADKAAEARRVDYHRAASKLRSELVQKIVGPIPVGFSPYITYLPEVTAEQRSVIERDIVERLGEHPTTGADWADDHTVVSVPIGEIGHWDIQ